MADKYAEVDSAFCFEASFDSAEHGQQDWGSKWDVLTRRYENVVETFNSVTGAEHRNTDRYFEPNDSIGERVQNH